MIMGQSCGGVEGYVITPFHGLKRSKINHDGVA